jgi:ketosteroid isomerase-like protein
MSEENVEIVQTWFERWNRGERDFPSDELLHPDFQVISRLQSEPFGGREGLRRWMQEIDQQFRDWKLVGDEWRESGDRVVVLGRVRLRGEQGGVALDQPGGWLFEFKDGKLFRLQPFMRPEEALEAAGLAE